MFRDFSPENNNQAFSNGGSNSNSNSNRSRTTKTKTNAAAESQKDDEMKQLLISNNKNVISNGTYDRPKEQSKSIPEKRLDQFGFIINMDSHGKLYASKDEDSNGKHQDEDETTSPQQLQLKLKREKKWKVLQTQWDATIKRRKKLLKHLRRGLPLAQRGTIWALLGKVPAKIRTATVTYQMLIQESIESTESSATSDDDAQQTNGQGHQQPSSNTKSFRRTQETIERDIHRTYPRHAMFHDDDIEDSTLDISDAEALKKLDKHHHHRPDNYQGDLIHSKGGQASLRRVLRAYSVYDKDVGYCQGMNFITGMFLTFMEEEESFWLLVAVMNDVPCRMRGLFGVGMRDTHQVLYIADQLMKQFLPKLYKHLEVQSVHITMYATQWLLTLYTSTFPFDLVTRVWDAFLGEGWKIVYRVMLALLQESQSKLLKLEFEDILGFFRDLPNHVTANNIMEVAMKIPLRRKHIAKHTKDYEKQQNQ
mmetsp:Transcript_39676/g.55953  ORF Transcript_39676/g.55953 Transcript_39676/m.55953 type:complete len:479 (+) Transcript_39676:224-1660(+)